MKKNKSILEQHREMLVERAKSNLRLVVLDYLTAQYAADGSYDPSQIQQDVFDFIDEFMTDPSNEE